MVKKLLSLILVVAMTLSMGSTYAFASEIQSAEQSNQMDSVDVIITGYSYAAGSSSFERSINTQISVTNLVPLYNPSDEIVAYYVTYSSNEYAVVNNNTDNPTVIEFGEGTQQYIEEILSNYENPKIIYNNPISVYEGSVANTLSTTNETEVKSIEDYYPELTVKNEALSAQLKNAKAAVEEAGVIRSTRGDGDYGFFSSSEMPSGTYTSDTILYATSVSWAKMSDYDDIANNHCGATAVTNLALYFAKNGYTNLKINDSKDDTFEAVHDIVGNGPVMMIAGHAETYFSNRGYDLNHSSVGDTAAIKTATTNDRPCGILLADGLFAWHWIIGVGWRQYTTSGDFYIRVNDNWNGSVNTYYKPGTGSAWWSATSYWVAD